MRHLKTFSLFESVQILTQDQENFLNKYTKGTWSFNPTTGEVDVDGDFNCSVSRLQSFGGIKFGEISGSFKCVRNSITSLEGCPHTVGADFECGVNPIKSLKGGPKTVGGTFSCQNSSSLTSVSGAPETVGRSFLCLLNSVKSLEGLPENMSVGGEFDCSYNKLTSLVGAPKIIVGNFRCTGNDLKSLEGAPQTVGGDFTCSSSGLITLEGGPKTVGGTFSCSENYIRNLKGAPETVGGDFLWTLGSSPNASLEGAPETIKGKFVTSDWQVLKGKWSIGTLIEIFLTGTPEEKRIVSPLVDPKVLQQQVDENPEKMLVNLKDHLKDPYLQGLKWPQHLETEKELLSDLGDIGL